MPPRPFLSSDQIGPVSLPDVLKAVERELALRDRLYPSLVASGKLSQVDAERHYAGMVGARRCVLEAMQLELSFVSSPSSFARPAPCGDTGDTGPRTMDSRPEGAS